MAVCGIADGVAVLADGRRERVMTRKKMVRKIARCLDSLKRVYNDTTDIVGDLHESLSEDDMKFIEILCENITKGISEAYDELEVLSETIQNL